MKRVGIVVIIFIILAFGIFFTFFYTPNCPNAACWEQSLRECNRAQYINSPIDVTWEYKIKGEVEDTCEVEVTALEIKRGLKNSQELLEGRTMDCYLPIGLTSAPEANPNFCTGPLKEGMQELIILKLHEYVLQNIGQISSELTEIPEITGNSSA